jgi:hypothetical protein
MPGFSFATPGPADGVSSLASQQSGPPPRRPPSRLSRAALCASGLIRGPFCHRYYDPLRMPNAHREFLCYPARPSLPVASAFSCTPGIGPAEPRAFPAGSFGIAVDSHEGDPRFDPRFHGQEAMRPSQVPVLSIYRHGLVYDPGGLRHASPYRRSRMLRSSTTKLSAFAHRESGTRRGLSPLGPQLSSSFRGSIQTLPTCSTRLPTFISSGRRVLLPGCWLGFDPGRTFTSWTAKNQFPRGSQPRFPRLRI